MTTAQAEIRLSFDSSLETCPRITIDADRLQVLIRLGLLYLDNELAEMEMAPDDYRDAVTTQEQGAELLEFLSPPSPDDGLPF